MQEHTTWDGGWTNQNGENTYPYKTDNSAPRDVHEAREANVHAGEANDARNYEL